MWIFVRPYITSASLFLSDMIGLCSKWVVSPPSVYNYAHTLLMLALPGLATETTLTKEIVLACS